MPTRPLARAMPLLDVVLALALVVSAVLTVSAVRAAPHPLAEIVAGSWMAVVALRTLAPTAMVVGCCLGGLAYTWVPHAPVTPLWAFVVALLTSFTIGAATAGRRRLLLGAALLVVGARLGVQSSDVADPAAWLTPAVISLAPAAAGALLQRARHQTRELRRLSQEIRAEHEVQARTAALEERHRVAGELHDVIASAVQEMTDLAGHALTSSPAGSSARDSLQVVHDTGVLTLEELREQLGVLSDLEAPEIDRPRSVPGLPDLGRLAAESGARLEYDVPRVGAVPAGTALTAFRVVQESLTNVRKHADGSCVEVRVLRQPGPGDNDELAVEVVNGPGRRLPVPSGGHGLPGMRERVDLYAGRMENGPTDDGGWQVRVWLPVPAQVGVPS